MIESAAVRDRPEIRAVLGRLHRPLDCRERLLHQSGFGHVDRQQVPPSVRESVAYQSACPASAIVTRKPLR